MGEFDVVVGSGTLRGEGGVPMAHRWTEGGVSVDASFTGAHLFHLAVAGCVLNDVHREAHGLGIDVAGVRVRASGDFDRETWQSTGVAYTVDVDSPASPAEVAALLARVDAVAEIPKALRQAAEVTREG